MSPFQRFVFKWHKKLSIFFAVPLVLWVLSGVAHPLMANWLKPELKSHPLPTPMLDLSQWSYSPGELREHHPEVKSAGFALMMLEGGLHYQVYHQGSISYYSAQDGGVVHDFEKRWLTWVLKSTLDRELDHFELVNSFHPEYRYINRILPVYRLKSGDLDLYLDAKTGKLLSFSTPLKRFNQNLFYYFHNFGFLNSLPSSLRYVLMSAILLGFLCVVISGAYVYLVRWKTYQSLKLKTKRQVLNRWHRALGLSMTLFCLMIVGSGWYHLSYKELMTQDSYVSQSVVEDSAIWELSIEELKSNISSTQGLDNVQPDNLTRIQKGDRLWVQDQVGQVYYPMVETPTISLAQSYLQDQSKCHGSVESSHLQTVFTQEYGFIRKILPVYHFQLESGNSCYVSLEHEKVTAAFNTADRTAGFIFSVFHKFHFLDGLGKDLRDGVVVLIMLGILALVGLGCLLWFQSRSQT